MVQDMWAYLSFPSKKPSLWWLCFLFVVLFGSACTSSPERKPDVASKGGQHFENLSPDGEESLTSVQPALDPLGNPEPNTSAEDLETSLQSGAPKSTFDPEADPALSIESEPKGQPGSLRAALPQGPSQAMRLVSSLEVITTLDDDLPLPPLLDAIERQIAFLEKSRRHEKFIFGDRILSKADYILGLHRFLEIGKQSTTKRDFLAAIQEEFDFYEVYGPPQGDWSEAKVTAYYEPVIPGSSKKTKKFSQAIYARPSDLVHARVKISYRPEKNCLDKKKGSKGHFCKEKRSILKGAYLARGRYVKTKKRWVLVPYYSRKQIDEKGALKKRHLELCWVDPLDAYFLQIEGSGTVIIDGDKTVRFRARDQNGHPYRGYSKDLQMRASQTGKTIEQYLRGLSSKHMQAFLNQNPSYVFFEPNQNGANTAMGLSATPGRTIATDARLFPKGALAFLIAKKPKFAGHEDLKPSEWEPLSRFVLDQDTGGAIRGGGRVDLFWGEGLEAKRNADVINQQGRLYYLVPKMVASQSVAAR